MSLLSKILINFINIHESKVNVLLDYDSSLMVRWLQVQITYTIKTKTKDSVICKGNISRFYPRSSQCVFNFVSKRNFFHTSVIFVC